MTTKIISSFYPSGYSLSAAYSELDITTAGVVEGTGVSSNQTATISNAGLIDATAANSKGVDLFSGGVVINHHGGYIAGTYGVFSYSAFTVENYGTIRATSGAVVGFSGGSVTNGAYTSLGATIAGSQIALYDAPGTVANFGTITAFVRLTAGGTITNGGVDDATALMNGGGGIYVQTAAGRVSNFGTVLAYGTPGANGVNLGAGGAVYNGAPSDVQARIQGGTGVLLSAAGTLINYGTVDGARVASGAYGAVLGGGGVVTNGGGADTGALIEGFGGVKTSGAAATVTNFATILGVGVASGFGVYLAAGGRLTNGGGANRSATIEGANGVATGLISPATVSNFGTVHATEATGIGVLMGQGALINGSLNNGGALIEGYTGALFYGTVAATNFATISGLGDGGGWGVQMGAGDSLINGAVRRTKATVEGFGGVYAVGSGDTVTNFGTLSGAAGTALLFKSAGDVLVVEAGSAFDGAVLGGGGMLDLATGSGTLTGLLAGGNVTVSGSMVATSFSNFNTVEIGAAATFATSGAVTITTGQSVIDLGLLTLGSAGDAVANAGTIETMGGTLTVNGAVSGAGFAKIAAGTLAFASTFNQPVTFNGTTGVLELGKSQTYTAAVRGFSKTGGTSLDLTDITFGGSTKATYSGTATSGTLTVTDGTHTAKIKLIGDYRTSTFTVASDGHGGTSVHDPAKTDSSGAAAWIASSPIQRFIAATAGFGASLAGPIEARAEAWRGDSHFLTTPRAIP